MQTLRAQQPWKWTVHPKHRPRAPSHPVLRPQSAARTRGQGRKPVKPGPEPAVTTSPAAWIRIGPGKFVRADSQDQGDASAPVPHAPLEAAEASIEAKSCPPDLVDHAPLEAAEASIEAKSCPPDLVDHAPLEAAEASIEAKSCPPDLVDHAPLEAAEASIEAKSCPPDLVDHAPLEAAEASIEAKSCPPDLVDHAPLEAAEASIEAKSSPPDLVEETNPNAVSTAVDVPNRAELNESGPSPEHETPSEEPAAIADPEPGSSVVALVLKADVGRQESDSTAAPATIAIDEDSPADSIVAEPVTEEYGTTPSAFGPSLLEASLEKEDHEQGWTDLPDSTGTGTKTPVDAGNGNGNRCNWMRLKLRSGVQTAFWLPSSTGEVAALAERNVAPEKGGKVSQNRAARQIVPHALWFGETSAVLPRLTAVINPAHHRRVPDRSPVPAPALPLTIEPAPAAGSTPLPAASRSASPSGSWYSWPDERMLAAGQNCPAVFATAKSNASGGSVKQWRRMPGAFPPQELCCFFWRHGSHHIVGNGK